MAQTHLAHPMVAERGSPLDDGLSGDNMEILTVDYSG